MDANIGRLLMNRYRVEEHLGSGGMANVYRAFDVNDNKIVAVKILLPELSDNPEFIRRFRNEAQSVISLGHPNIVKIYNVNFDGGEQFIVMEYINGITLRQYLDTKKVLDNRDAIHFTVQILRALSHAHSKGVIHRDVKPDNIMLMHDGTVKMMDFGIAKLARDDTEADDGQTIGSVHYISPEQAKGQAQLDARSDLYSVGVMLYEMLTGQKPFDAAKALDIAMMQVRDNPTAPRMINPNLQIGIEEIILKAMEKSPFARYASAADMLRDIEFFKKDNSIVFGYEKEKINLSLFGKNNYQEQDESTKFFNPQTEEEYDDDDDYEDDDTEDLDDEEEEEEEGRSMFVPILSAVTIVVIIAAVFFVVSLLTGVFGENNNRTETFTVPDLIGKTITQAQEMYPDLTIVMDGTPQPSELEPDMIFFQFTPANTVVKIGTEIRVKVSSGVERIEIPNLIGQDYSSAGSILEQKGLKVKLQPDISNEYNRSIVFELIPPAGTMVDPNTEVIVRYSIGADAVPVVMPKFIGMLFEDAKFLALNKGITLEAATEYSHSSEPYGTVISQSIPENTDSYEGVVVTVVLSDGTAISNEVQIDFNIPSGYVGSYQIDIYMSGVLSATSGAFNAGYSPLQGVKVTGTGIMDITAVLTNLSSTQTSTIGVYTVDFTNKTYNGALASMDSAFFAIGERDPAATAAPPNPTTTTAPTTAAPTTTVPTQATEPTTAEPTTTEPTTTEEHVPTETDPPDTEPVIPAGNE